MRQIEASEVKPGMTVRWEQSGITHEYKVAKVTPGSISGLFVCSPEGGESYIGIDTEVTVLAEPQPEEPTELGARVRVRDGRFLRLDWGDSSARPWHEKGTGYRWTWDDVCSLGRVTVIPDQGWTVPDDTPEVPERIEEWPEDDTALRPYPWRDRGGYTWKWIAAVSGWECYDELDDYVESGVPPYGPLTRVTDA